MNNQEAVEMIRNDMKLHHDYLSGEYRKALSMAVSALEMQDSKRRICDTCKHDPPSKKWPCVDCDMREPADRWEPNECQTRKHYDDASEKCKECLELYKNIKLEGL